MCFKIDKGATPWKQTIVFKVVRKRQLGGKSRYTGPHSYGKRTAYVRNQRTGINRHSVTNSGGKTYAGIYVLDSLLRAQSYARCNFPREDVRIVKARVSPRSFLFAAGALQGYDGCATYRSIVPVGNYLKVST